MELKCPSDSMRAVFRHSADIFTPGFQAGIVRRAPENLATPHCYFPSQATRRNIQYRGMSTTLERYHQVFELTTARGDLADFVSLSNVYGENFELIIFHSLVFCLDASTQSYRRSKSYPRFFCSFSQEINFPMAPAKTPVVAISGIFQRQQASGFMPRQYQRQPFSHRSGSSSNSTADGGTPSGAFLSVTVAVPIVMLLFIVCALMWQVVPEGKNCLHTRSSDAKQNQEHRALGYIVLSSKRKAQSQPDNGLEERKRRIFSRMAAPVMCKTLNLDTVTPTHAETFHDNRDSSELRGLEMMPEHQRRAAESQSKIEAQDHIWYFPSVFPSLNEIPVS